MIGKSRVSLERGLSEDGHRVSIAGNGREGAEMMMGGGYDVALLDILLPGIVAWNQLLDRLEGAVSRLSKFSADASHDLRTSITVILATAQVSLDRRRSEEEYRSDLERIVSECRIASTLLDALLSLARSGNFVHEVAFQRINVTELVVAGCRRVEDLAESNGIHRTQSTMIS